MKTKRPIGGIDVVFACTTMAGLLGLGLTRLALVPAFTEMFADFGGPLPTITLAAIATWPTAIVVVLVVALAAVGLWRRRVALLVVATVLAALAIGLTVAAMYAPIFELAGNVRAE
ncbi:MAG: hypothetical protein HYY06_15695 [Deltaproteobacteria bacterium]|nr:hypothetical protein [Deltaproteobacteria bacterium]